jgi:hypothetical protein
MSARHILILVLIAACGGADDEEPLPAAPVVGEAIGTVLFDAPVELVDGRARIDITAPDDVAGIGVTVVGRSSARYRLCEWEAPGLTLVPAGWEDQGDTFVFCESCANRIQDNQEVHSVFAPNSSGVALTGGAHRLEVCGTRSSDQVHVAIVGAPQRAAGAVTLALYFTGANGWQSASWSDDPDLQQLIADTASRFAPEGIDVAVAGAWDRPDLRTLTEGEIGPLIASLVDHPAGAIPVVFAERFEATFPALAQSFGLPGPFLTETPAGAIVVSLDNIGAGERPLERILAHEIGHYLGLYHTTEVVFDAHDPLDDTPQDDDSYLMHALPEGDSISPEQGALMRRNPHLGGS